MKSKSSFITPYELKALDQTLLAWGVFTRLELGESIGSLSDNRRHLLSMLGTKVSGSRHEIRWTDNADQVDRLINKLSKVKPKWANAVKWHYTEPGDIRQQAKVHGLPKSTYFERFQHGRQWLGREFYRLH